MTQVAAIVQARTSSRRMPRKVLAPLAGAPALARMLERLERARRIDRLIVATSTDGSDDAVEALCRAQSVACVRGCLDDVLARFAAALPADCDVVVRLTGDCPLIDAQLVDDHIARYAEHHPAVDYVSNAVVRSYPDGLDTEVINAELVRVAAREARAPGDREHVTPWIQRRARQLPVAQDVDLSALRWTLDTPADYEIIAAVFDRLHPQRPAFDRFDVCRLLVDEPGLIHTGEALDAAARDGWRQRIRRYLKAEQ